MGFVGSVLMETIFLALIAATLIKAAVVNASKGAAA